MDNNCRSEMCEDCLNSLKTYDYEDIHEHCSAGICILCFQSKKIDCEEYKPKLHSLEESIKKYGDENLHYYLDSPKDTLGIVTKNPDMATFKYSFIVSNNNN